MREERGEREIQIICQLKGGWKNNKDNFRDAFVQIRSCLQNWRYREFSEGDYNIRARLTPPHMDVL